MSEILSCYVKTDSGRPKMYINDEPCVPVLYGMSDIPASASRTVMSQRNIGLFADCGIDIVQVDCCLYRGWRKAEPFDIAPISEEVAGVLEANPKAAVMIRLHMNAPYWWMRDHMEENTVFEGVEAIDNGDYGRLIDGDHRVPYLRTSLASELWKKEAGEKLATFCQQLGQMEEGNRVIGIQVACGTFGEWHYWGVLEGEPDYSKPMVERLRRRLKEKYVTVENLQKAWKDDTVTFENAQLATSAMRYAGTHGWIREGQEEARVIDTCQCIQSSVPDAINYFAEIIHKSFPRPIIAGTFYCYFLNGHNERSQIGGHLEPMTLLDSEHVDFLCGPFPYKRNREIDGMGISRGLLESIRLHGKLWLTEMDQPPIGYLEYQGGDPAKLKENCTILKRNALDSVSRGMGFWYYDHRDQVKSHVSWYRKKGWWDHPVLLETIHKLQNVFDRYSRTPYEGQADVLLVYDRESYYYMNFNVYSRTELDVIYGISHSGVAYDCIYAEDLDKCDLSRYKCVVMACVPFIRKERREKLQRMLYADNRHVVWLYAGGYADDVTTHIDNITEMTHFTVQKSETAKSYQYNGVVYEIPEYVEERFCVNDADATSFLNYDNGECAGAYKEHENGVSWYLGWLPESPYIWIEIFRKANVHFYVNPGNVATVGSGIVAIEVMNEQGNTIRMKDGRVITVPAEKNTLVAVDASTGEILDV